MWLDLLGSAVRACAAALAYTTNALIHGINCIIIIMQMTRPSYADALLCVVYVAALT